MNKTILDEVYVELMSLGIISSETEFSKDWLGRSECYLRTLRFEQKPPSLATIAICASKLKHYGDLMMNHKIYKRTGKKFITLSEKCHSEINKTAQLTWLDQQ
jgi:hypothetical protein